MKKWVPAFQLLGIGFYIATCIVGGILAGWWLGSKKPIFVIIGLIVGLILAFYGSYSMIRPIMKRENRKDNKNDEENG